MVRLHRQLAVFLLALCCLAAQSVSVVAAPCGMNEHGGSSALTEQVKSMAAMDEHAHHAVMQADTASASDCCGDQENCSMTQCYAGAVMLSDPFSTGNLVAATLPSAFPVSNVRFAHTAFFKPPISL